MLVEDTGPTRKACHPHAPVWQEYCGATGLSSHACKEVPITPATVSVIQGRLRAWGVARLYGYPGDGINGMLGALDNSATPGGWRLRDKIGPMWDHALPATRPVVLDVVTDPNVPPVPPHVPPQSIRNYMKALLGDDPQGNAVLRATAREMWAQVFPAVRPPG